MKETVTPERCTQAHEGVGFYTDIDGNLQYDPLKVIPPHKFAAAAAVRARAGVQEPAPGAPEPPSSPVTKSLHNKEEAYQIATSILKADLQPQVTLCCMRENTVGALVDAMCIPTTTVFAFVCVFVNSHGCMHGPLQVPADQPAHRGRKSKNKQGAIITNLSHVRDLEQAREDELEKARKSAKKALQDKRNVLKNDLASAVKQQTGLLKKKEFLQRHADAAPDAKTKLQAKNDDLSKLNSG